MKRKYRLNINPQTISAEKLQEILDELEKLGVWQNSRIVYDDSDKELCQKIMKITDVLINGGDMETKTDGITVTSISDDIQEGKSGIGKPLLPNSVIENGSLTKINSASDSN